VADDPKSPTGDAPEPPDAERELYMDVEADEALGRLDADDTLRGLTTRVNATIDALLENPGDSKFRRRRFRIGLWCVTVVDGTNEWVILWEPHPDDQNGIIIQYLGPASFI
jgi:hypothetical protein